MKNIIFISPNSFLKILSVVIVLLTLASAAGSLSEQLSIDNYLLAEARDSFIRLFIATGEANIMAWYSSSALLLCSFLLGIIAQAKKINHGVYILHWWILSLAFLYLSVDEAAVIHEMGRLPMRYLFNLGGIFYYGWIIPAGIAVLIFGLAYLKFLAHLPSKTKWLFVVSGGIFVGGAIGTVAIVGLLNDFYGQGRIASDEMLISIKTIGEFFEMLGIVIFIYALLDYMSSHFKQVSFQIVNQQPEKKI